MKWYWIALVLGIVAPWVVMWTSLRIAFEEGGLLKGFGAWFGMCLLIIPMMFLIMWVGEFFIGP